MPDGSAAFAANNNKTHDVAFLILINKNGEIFLQQRNYKCQGWGFPGGYADPTDPNPEYTAAREFKEETGISICASCLKPVRPIYEVKKRRCALFYLEVGDKVFPELQGSKSSEACRNEAFAYMWTSMDELPLNTMDCVWDQINYVRANILTDIGPATRAPALTACPV